MELPPDAYISETKKDMFTLRNNRFNTEGKPEQIEVNQYRMTKFDFSKKIYQYDVSISQAHIVLAHANHKFRSSFRPTLTRSALS
jgi:hypothetical protein